jgi:hypothetical protein
MPAKPIKYIIADGWDVGFYARKEDAEGYMEAIDVQDGVYVGYDAEGRLLEIVPWASGSQIRVAENTPGHQQELRELLLGLLERIGKKPQGTDLPSLLTMFDEWVK